MLTDLKLKRAARRDKPYKISDQNGLFVLVSPNGSKLWRLAFRFDGKQQLLALGAYPEVSLREARDKRDDARRLLASGINPAFHRKLEKIQRVTRAANSFESVALEWFAKFSPQWAHGHSSKIKRRLERDVFPWIGARPIAEITAPELLAVLRRIESRGAIETAHRAHQNCGQVFRYAVATDRAHRDPSADLRGAIPPAQSKHHPSIIDPKGIGELLRAIRGYRGSFVTACALRLAPLVFVRPTELRHAEWSEFDLDRAEWRIPAEKMKMRGPHIVPLSVQAVDILRELHPLTGNGNYVFPGERSRKRPMSENTVNAALRRLGYGKDEMTGHGFRSMASTLLNEHGWHRDAIERQLAHAERDDIRAAYNYAEHLKERRRMMQAWADYLDKLEAGKTRATISPRSRSQALRESRAQKAATAHAA
jgi:integrase